MLLDVSFGIFAFLPQGWVFEISVFMIEAVVASKILVNRYYDASAYLTMAISNLTSGLIGIFISLALNGGWWLVCWLPVVSRREVDLSDKGVLIAFCVYYFCAFIVTLFIEGVINYLILKNRYGLKKIWKLTWVTNVITYVLGSIILYVLGFLVLG